MFTNVDPTVLNRDADPALLKLTAQAGTEPNVRNIPNTAAPITVVIFFLMI
jgi:hypothetical protein